MSHGIPEDALPERDLTLGSPIAATLERRVGNGPLSGVKPVFGECERRKPCVTVRRESGAAMNASEVMRDTRRVGGSGASRLLALVGILLLFPGILSAKDKTASSASEQLSFGAQM